jgi:hypothetical protein
MHPQFSRKFLPAACRSVGLVYTSSITKPPEGLGVRLVSAGPLFFFRLIAAVAVWACVACTTPSTVLTVHPQVRAVLAQKAVELEGRIACRQGFLEQLVCRQGTRDHESLIVTTAPASAVHAALLAAGLQAGTPGSWSVDRSGALQLIQPQGETVQVLVRWVDATGERTQPLAQWMVNTRADPGQPAPAFVFAGSRFRRMADGSERYAADDSGSIVGLVTFGDEVVAMRTVIPDKVDVAPAAWKARTDDIPPEGSVVTVIFRALEQP